jgi:hypothetical protein
MKIWYVSDFSFKDAKACWMLSLSFLINVTAGMFALSKVNIPIFLALRRMTTLFVFLFDFFVLKRKQGYLENAGIFFLTIGAILAGVINM